MEKLTPVRVYSLGDYYDIAGLRELCHAVKEGDGKAMRKAAKGLCKLLPQGCTLVPVPSRSGHNETFTRKLAVMAGLPYRKCLDRSGGESLYDLKRRGVRVTEETTGIKPGPDVLPEGHVILVDNVIATGTTMSAAIRAIGRPCEAAVIAVDNTANT